MVIRSFQVIPRASGYTPSTLFDTLEKLKKTDQSVILSAACRCNRVSNG
ncbi:hypothetical protein GMMP1_1260002 [Candidatus Magnetomoraceae bacterium gMMP-1]